MSKRFLRGGDQCRHRLFAAAADIVRILGQARPESMRTRRPYNRHHSPRKRTGRSVRQLRSSAVVIKNRGLFGIVYCQKESFLPGEPYNIAGKISASAFYVENRGPGSCVAQTQVVENVFPDRRLFFGVFWITADPQPPKRRISGITAARFSGRRPVRVSAWRQLPRTPFRPMC